MVTRKSINIDDILVNVLNPRFDPQEDEIMEMDLIINDGSKILTLIEDIARYGLDPSDSLIVSYDENLEIYVSNEGNRRTTAIKILNDPGVTPQFTRDRDKFISKVIKIKEKYAYDTISMVDCVIFDDVETRDHFIKLKHTGENDGAGRIGWDRESIIRFDKNPFSVYLLEKLTQMFPSQKKFNTSTIERILADPNMREALDLDINKNEPSMIFSSDQGFKKFYYIVRELIEGNFKVNDFYYKKDRLDFIDNHLLNEMFDDSKIGTIKNVFKTVENQTSNETKSNNKHNQTKHKQTSLFKTSRDNQGSKESNSRESGFKEVIQDDIPSIEAKMHSDINDKEKQQNINLGRPRKEPHEYDNLLKAFPFKNKYRTNKKINQTVKELGNINYKEYPIASIFLIRSFLETYVNDYIDHFAALNRSNSSKMKNINPNREKRTKKLRELLYDDIYNHLKITLERFPETYNLIHVTFTENNKTSTIQIINFYIHSGGDYPDPKEILEAWQKISSIVKTLDYLLAEITGQL
ncbi:hypothetical protein [Evansella tamaricis]|uniref:Uncharacterized protein n=1 Tax=Evansella tamaricis TaxID=2069301 RepID=A0ABS6JP05_9BACI|nr:hypothetical protein [Evansella tamaricis]MBU9714125.1 hypothetical protein [Evansella tamaricis]